MNYYELSVKFPSEYEDKILDEIEIKTKSIGIIAYHTDVEEKDKSSAVLHLYYRSEDLAKRNRERVSEIFKQLKIDYDIEGVNVLEENDYLNAYKDFLKPILIENEVWLIPSSPGSDDIDDGRKKVYIDSQYSFGTGSHPTTKIAMTFLVNFSKSYPNKDVRVLDLGAGSGILSVLALKLGFSNITAVDVDENSAPCTEENAKINGLKTPKLLTGSVDCVSGEKYKLILMNIETEVIINLFKNVVLLLEPGASLILSGILRERHDEVQNLVNESGFEILALKEEGEWEGMWIRKK